MNASTLSAQDGQANTIKRTFNQETSVGIMIQADPAIIWTLLTNADDFARWNSTIVSLEGDIRLGEKIRLISTLDESRTFKIKIKEFIPEQHMVWGDGKGSRTFTLTTTDTGTRFEMHEKIGGLMYPLYAKYLPPFQESFEKFASDLKSEAETIANTQ